MQLRRSVLHNKFAVCILYSRFADYRYSGRTCMFKFNMAGVITNRFTDVYRS